MTHSFRARTSRLALTVTALGALSLAAGCLVDLGDSGGSAPPEPTAPEPDAAPAPDPGEPPARDAGSDASEPPDACADGACEPAPQSWCEGRPDAAFCDDFDDPDALTFNKTKWDFLEPTEQPVLTLSSAVAVSAPTSLLSRVLDKDTPGAKFAKTLTKAGFTEVTWEYDVFFASIGAEDGFFLDDFQFSDAAGPDSFGFRLVMFAEAGGIRELKVEHNPGAIGGEYVIEPALPAGAVELGKWHRFEQKVTFSFASEGDADAEHRVAYSLRIDGEPRFEKQYRGLSREQAQFARVAGLPFVFNKERSAGLEIYWDNHVVGMK